MTKLITPLAAVVAAGWAVYLHLAKKKEPPPSSQISASSGGFVVGGDVTATAQPGGTAVIATGPVNIGITLEQHYEFLKRREKELRAEFTTKASPEEKAVLGKQLRVMVQQLANLKESHPKRVSYLQKSIVDLGKLKGELPEEVLAATKAALAQGDTSKEDALFREIEKKADAPIKQAAEAAYQRGLIAESRIDYRTAHAKFRRATQLQPDNTNYYANAGTIARTLGLYDEAIESHEKALGLYRSGEGDQSVNVAMQWNNLGIAWRDKGEYDKAIGFYEMALKVYERSLGKDHPLTRQAQANLRVSSEARAAKKP